MIEFFFDCSSPWTYLAFHNIQPLAAELGVPIRWRPVLVGGIFNAVNPSVYAMRENPVPPKRDYMLKDLQDWASEARLRIVFPPRVFPVNSVKAMRACIVLDHRASWFRLPPKSSKPTSAATRTFRKTPFWGRFAQERMSTRRRCSLRSGRARSRSNSRPTPTK